MSRAAYDRLAAALGASVDRGPGDRPRVTPRSADELANALGLIHQEGWSVAIAGRGSWMPADAPAEVLVTTVGLDRITAIAPADLVATAQAGVSLDHLGERLGAHGAWLALDPPGSRGRSLGSVLATGTAGPVRHRFGPVRDHVLGATVATVDGRLVRSGGVVVKNVAGYDLTKIQIGGFGAFGVIVEAHLRLRARPEVRRLLVGRGSLDPLFNAGRALVGANLDAAAIELVSPGATGAADWRLLVLLQGTTAGVTAEVERARPVAETPLDEGQPSALESAARDPFGTGPVTLRVGSLPPSLPDVADLVLATLGPGAVSLGPGSGSLRWCGDTTAGAIRELRRELAGREVPVTLERAPWPIRAAAGHYGAFREGVRPLADRVRAVFDPAGLTMAALAEPAGG